MRIDSHRRASERHSLHHVGGLTAHTGQTQELVEILRNLSSMLVHQHTGHLYKMFCLGIRIRHALDILINLVRLSRRHIRGIGIIPEKFGRYLVHPFVRALRAEYHCHKQLEHTAELEFGCHLRHTCPEIVEDILISFFFCHILCNANMLPPLRLQKTTRRISLCKDIENRLQIDMHDRFIVPRWCFFIISATFRDTEKAPPTLPETFYSVMSAGL